MSGALMRVVWHLSRRAALLRPGTLALAGPAAPVVVIASWAAFLAFGWALIYWPYLPDGFLLVTGIDPSTQDGVLDALYLSVVTLATLGYGHIALTASPRTLGSPRRPSVCSPLRLPECCRSTRPSAGAGPWRTRSCYYTTQSPRQWPPGR